MLGEVERADQERLAEAEDGRATQVAEQQKEARRRLSELDLSTAETDSMQNNPSITTLSPHQQVINDWLRKARKYENQASQQSCTIS